MKICFVLTTLFLAFAANAQLDLQLPLMNQDLYPRSEPGISTNDAYPSFESTETDWYIEWQRSRYASQDASQAPCIMMAGYMDSDISYANGGTLNMLAYVYDENYEISEVEIYWEGNPVGVYLQDDGLHGDFGDSDGLWGFLTYIPPETVPAGEYLLELRAKNSAGFFSDLWPYLTIHPE